MKQKPARAAGSMPAASAAPVRASAASKRPAKHARTDARAHTRTKPASDSRDGRAAAVTASSRDAAGQNAAVPVGDLSFDALLASLDASVDAHTHTHAHTSAPSGSGRKKEARATATAAKPRAQPQHAAPVSKQSAGSKARIAAHTRAEEENEEDEEDEDEDEDEDEEEEEEVEEAEEAARAPARARVSEGRRDVPLPTAPNFSSHRAQLDGLKETDPEFYAFLLKNDRTLLEFGKEEEAEDGEEGGEAGGDDDEDAGEDGDILRGEESEQDDDSEGDVGDVSDLDEEEGDEDEDEEEEGGTSASSTRKRARPDEARSNGARAHDPPELTSSMFRAICESAIKQQSWKGLQKLMHAYRAACFMGEGSDILSQLGLLVNERENQAKKKKAKKGAAAGGDRSAMRSRAEDAESQAPKALKFRIVSSAVFMKVIVTTLRDAEPLLSKHLGTLKRRKSAGAAADASAAPDLSGKHVLYDYTGWERMSSLVKAFLHSTLHLLREAQDPALQQFLLRAVRPYVPFLQPFHRLIRNWLKALQHIFSVTEDQTVRVAAFLRVRHLAIALPQPTLDTALKGLYLAYVRTAKYMSETASPNILFMANCVAEMYGVDETAAYQHAFIYVRQLALHLRGALTTKSKNALANVLSWQYLNCLKLWGLVLCKYGTDAGRPLFQLVYPVVQIMLGAVRLMPSARYYPLRLHIVGILTELCWHTGVYIPVAPLLLDVLHSPMLSAKPKGAATSMPPVLHLMVKVSDATMATRAYQEVVASRVFDLLLDAMKTQYCSVAFPELATPVIASLRAFAKVTRVAAWRHRAKALVDALAGQAAKVSLKRDALHAAPADRAAMAAFMSTEAATLREERARQRAAASASEAAAARDAKVSDEGGARASGRRVSFSANLIAEASNTAGKRSGDGAATTAGTKRSRKDVSTADSATRSTTGEPGKPLSSARPVAYADEDGEEEDVVEDMDLETL